MGGNLPGQSVTLCGQPTQVAACGSHSAGILEPSAISRQPSALVGEKSVLNIGVRVGAAVAQERPVATHRFDPGQVDLRQHERLVLGGLGHDDAERIADERMAPELEPCALAAQPLETAAGYWRHPATG